MKLLQLLAKELKEWPEADCEQGRIESMSQAGDMQVSHYSDCRQVWREDVHDWSGHDYVPCSRFKLPELATDHATAIVTRADWESEKALIVGKADGGWKRHRGGKCPVDRVTPVEVRMRSGEKLHTFDAYEMRWSHNGGYGDIMAYRIHNPAEQPAPVSEEVIVEDKTGNLSGLTVPHHMLFGYASKEEMREATGCESLQEVVQMITKGYVTYAPDAVEQDGPLAWRDRIRALDTQRAELEATHQRQIGEIDGERGELVSKLAEEGLALVEVVQPVEDMSDWRNWKAGDLVECRTDRWPGVYTRGDQYEVIQASPLRIADDCGGADSHCLIGEKNAERFKWHSRPGK